METTELVWNAASGVGLGGFVQIITAIGSGAAAWFAYKAASANRRSAEATERVAYLQQQHLDSMMKPHVKVRCRPPGNETDSFTVSIQNVGMYDLTEVHATALMKLDGVSVFETVLVSAPRGQFIDVRRGATATFWLRQQDVQEWLGKHDLTARKLRLAFAIYQGHQEIERIGENHPMAKATLSTIFDAWAKRDSVRLESKLTAILIREELRSP